MDPEAKTLTTYTKNVTFTRLMVVEEKCVYSVHPTNKEWWVLPFSALHTVLFYFLVVLMKRICMKFVWSISHLLEDCIQSLIWILRYEDADSREMLFKIKSEFEVMFFHNLANLTLTPSTGCAKTYVRLSWTGRNLVLTCKPLTWLVHIGQAHF